MQPGDLYNKHKRKIKKKYSMKGEGFQNYTGKANPKDLGGKPMTGKIVDVGLTGRTIKAREAQKASLRAGAEKYNSLGQRARRVFNQVTQGRKPAYKRRKKKK